MKICIAGISGKMGRAVAAAAKRKKEIEEVFGVDLVPCEGYRVFPSFSAAPAGADAVIDFSSPSLLGGLLGYAESCRAAAVIGTTGFTEADIKRIKEAAGRIPVCLSPNFSAGISVLERILPLISAALPQFDRGLAELHGRAKKDSPSGTAKALAAAAGIDERAIVSLRGGNAAGQHTVYFMGQNEMITLTHTAFSREAFADGAVEAALRLAGKPAGLYALGELFEG